MCLGRVRLRFALTAAAVFAASFAGTQSPATSQSESEQQLANATSQSAMTGTQAID